MRKNSLFALAVMVSLLITVPWAPAQDTMDALYLPVGTLTISPPRGVEPRRTPVAFPHSRHFDYNCKFCHHKWDGHSPVNNCSASGCHDIVAPSRGSNGKIASDTEDMRYFKTAYHQNCITCHKELKLTRQTLEKSATLLTQPLPKTGPTGCIECHPRD